jgi:arginine N-succinyltransferase
MILLRPIEHRDMPALQRFAQTPGLYNIPNDLELLEDRIKQSQRSFRDRLPLSESRYIFVAEDLGTNQVVGTSMIAGQHGTASSPHFYFQVGSEKKYSDAIGTGFIHGTLELQTLREGPSEIGGLVVDPNYRKHPEKIGKQIFLVRFFYLAAHPERFRDQVIAELLPPLNKRGQSPLWEAIGRRFTNMDYWEADELCQKNKEFILSLFPEGKIYTTFLPAEARNAIGKVGKETEPALRMLKRLGFRYANQVDPFDGGPHFWARTSEISILKNFRTGTWRWVSPEEDTSLWDPWKGWIATESSEGKFCALKVSGWHLSESQVLAFDPKTVLGGVALRDGFSHLNLKEHELCLTLQAEEGEGR